jgi:hypothetical protein
LLFLAFARAVVHSFHANQEPSFRPKLAHSLIVSSAVEKSASPPRSFPTITVHFVLRSPLNPKIAHSECGKEPGVLLSQNYFSAFSTQKSHVKPRNHLNASNEKK